MKKRVGVAISGGVDSAVATLLLKKEFEVIGFTMYLGIDRFKDENFLRFKSHTIEDAKKICEKLEIPHYILDLSKELEEMVIKKFISEYLKARTPNPCIECNRFVKFGVFLEKVLSKGCDFFATGHYAKVEKIGNGFLLKKAKDKSRDQTYFLYSISKEKFKHIIFPLANFTKERVRKIAQKYQLPVDLKSQSQDICFIPHRDYRKFISERVKDIKPGSILDLKGNFLGMHKGIVFYTVGQKEGLGINTDKPLYVVNMDAEKNQIIVGEREFLRAKGLIANRINILTSRLPSEAEAKIRYSHQPAKCKVSLENEKLKIIFYEEQEAITPGQSVVLYQKDVVIGGGIIEEVLNEYSERN